MQRTRTLKEGCFPTLRWSFFCGEPLLAKHADAWQEAAPQSIIENLYGPTEATIVITHYRWRPEDAGRQFVNGGVPIGTVFPTQKAVVIDPEHNVVGRGVKGELCLGGSQVTAGYLHNPEKTREQFISLAATGSGRWYRTGDVVREEEDGCFVYLGRIDDQIQIRGHRVELQEVDHALREASGSASAVSVAWPAKDGRADGVYGFLCLEEPVDRQDILTRCAKLLPEYMCPRKLFVIPELPLNASGKIDRNALAKRVGGLLHDK